ncbi:hypothetical protein [Variovorax paradoxus]|uniref:hypothetical protein n=1 Tax=Variovorax paradoxus TaxID=34073 RepID=UPI0012D3F6D2|nr:hypothetical protein [Variovorax paradoxus]
MQKNPVGEMGNKLSGIEMGRAELLNSISMTRLTRVSKIACFSIFSSEIQCCD